MKPDAPLIILALDGLEWPFLQTLVDAGQAPFLQSLIESGVSAPLAFPPPHFPESAWTTIATGMLPDRHGVLHPMERIDAGLFTRGVRANSVRSPTLWEIADRAGDPCRVIGWPATQGLELQHGMVVASGVERAMGALEQIWPIPPDAITPYAMREAVRALRLHPQEIGTEELVSLLAPLSAASRERIAEGMARALAECATVHAIATDRLAQSPGAVLAVRLNFVDTVGALLARVAGDPGAGPCLARCYQFLDLLCGRYLHLAGRAAHYAVLATGSPVPRSGGDTQGFAIVAGPGVRRDALLGPIDAADVMPTLLALRHRSVPAGLDGVAIEEIFDAPDKFAVCVTGSPDVPRLSHVASTGNREPFDAAALAREGLPIPDFSGYRQVACTVECETLFSLALVSHYRGDARAAIESLRQVLARFPDFIPAQVRLAELLLETGKTDESESIVCTLPLVRQSGLWADVAHGLVAFARGDWADARDAFVRLAAAPESPLNASTWLGMIALHQQQWPDAMTQFQRAVSQQPRDVQAWRGLAQALNALAQHAQAVVAWGRAAALQPRCAVTLIALAEAHERVGDTGRAAMARTRALKINPGLVARRLVQ